MGAVAEWLKGLGIATVAMESTGVYWIPAFEILQARGVEVVLVNARDAKTVPGRKTDVNDAQWLQQLDQYGLLRRSFHPSRGVAALRAYLRHRERLLDYAAAHVQHMHKALTQMPALRRAQTRRREVRPGDQTLLEAFPRPTRIQATRGGKTTTPGDLSSRR